MGMVLRMSGGSSGCTKLRVAHALSEFGDRSGENGKETPRLMSGDFPHVSWTLKNLALSNSDQEALAKTIKSIVIPPDVVAEIDGITRS